MAKKKCNRTKKKLRMKLKKLKFWTVNIRVWTRDLCYKETPMSFVFLRLYLGTRCKPCFPKIKILFFLKINLFYVFWIVLMRWSQKWFLKNKKNIILIHFDTKNILKNNYNHTFKHVKKLYEKLIQDVVLIRFNKIESNFIPKTTNWTKNSRLHLIRSLSLLSFLLLSYYFTHN